jgi:hypothetical protein
MATDTNNPEFQLAAQFVNQTSRPIFLTGRAGTGKTTFLRYIRENSSKKMAVVAPTGVAAINAGGTTLHSFFQLPFGPFIPTVQFGWQQNSNCSDPNTLLQNIRLTAAKRELLQELDLLIIDEISMVRADTLDAVDTILRHFRQQPLQPFGGLQLLFIGDLYQLPPVVTDTERQLLRDYYTSPFFFDARVIREASPVYIELQQIYRQKDDEFIRLLNDIRNNKAGWEDLERLNDYYQPDFIPSTHDNYITLTSHNARAEAINQDQLSRLRGATHRLDAVVTGEFPEKSYPAEKTLILKEGAQVMLIRNDKGETRRFYNGKLGTIREIGADRLTLAFPDEPDLLVLEPETWKNVRYSYEREKDKIEEEELGTFRQYPIRLAWAITIHKSQGLTFEKAVIDAGASFAAGQVYVALSRLTTLKGLVLRSRITPFAISTDAQVVAFTEKQPGAAVAKQQLEQEQLVFIGDSLRRAFEWSRLAERFRDHCDGYDRRKIPEKEKAISSAGQWLEKMEALQEVARRFSRQLEELLPVAEENGYRVLHGRVSGATGYFTTALGTDILQPLQQQISGYRGKKTTKKYLRELETLKQLCARKQQQLQEALQLVSGLQRGTDAGRLLSGIEESRRMATSAVAGATGTASSAPAGMRAGATSAASLSSAAPRASEAPEKPQKGDTHRKSLELYRQGMSAEEIAAQRDLRLSTIEGHLALYVSTGDIDIKELVPEHKMDPIIAAIKEMGASALSPIRSRLGNDYSFGEIKAVINYLKLIPSADS